MLTPYPILDLTVNYLLISSMPPQKEKKKLIEEISSLNRFLKYRRISAFLNILLKDTEIIPNLT